VLIFIPVLSHAAAKSFIACLHDQAKSGFFEGPAFIQLITEQFKKYSKSYDWLEKCRPSKKPLLF